MEAAGVAISTDRIWTGTHGAAKTIGITSSALILLQRDGQVTPDCLACGRNRYKIKEMEERADELKAYLASNYPQSLDDLLLHD